MFALEVCFMRATDGSDQYTLLQKGSKNKRLVVIPRRNGNWHANGWYWIAGCTFGGWLKCRFRNIVRRELPELHHQCIVLIVHDTLCTRQQNPWCFSGRWTRHTYWCWKVNKLKLWRIFIRANLKGKLRSKLVADWRTILNGSSRTGNTYCSFTICKWRGVDGVEVFYSYMLLNYWKLMIWLIAQVLTPCF